MKGCFFTIRVKGLGLYLTIEALSYAFVASIVQYCVLHKHILRNSGISSMDADFDSVLDGLGGTVSDFEFNNFISKDMFWQVSFLVKVFRYESKVWHDHKTENNFWMFASNTCSKFSSSYPDLWVIATYVTSKVSYHPHISSHEFVISYWWGVLCVLCGMPKYIPLWSTRFIVGSFSTSIQ